MFAPHCSAHLAQRTSAVISELIGREPLLLGAILTIASRYYTASSASSTGSAPTSLSSSSVHHGISEWTQRMVGQALFDHKLKTIGSIEALLMLSEWATKDIHAAYDAFESASDSEIDTDGELSRSIETAGTGMDAANIGAPKKTTKRTGKRKQQARGRLLEPAERFDGKAWMLVSMVR